MIEKIFTIIPTVATCISAVSLFIMSIVQYLSCDSCKEKRKLKLAKLYEKINQKEINK